MMDLIRELGNELRSVAGTHKSNIAAARHLAIA
jgi:hypothetical protein